MRPKNPTIIRIALLSDRLAKLDTMPRPAFEKFGAQLQSESSRICTLMIEAGRGHWRNAETEQAARNGDELAISYQTVSDALYAWYAQEKYRLRMHGCLRPWKSKVW